MVKKKILFCKVGWAAKARKEHEINGVDYYRMVLPGEAINKYSNKYEVVLKGKIAEDNESAIHLWDRLYNKENYSGVMVKNMDTLNAVAQLIWARDLYSRKVIMDLDDNMNYVQPSSKLIHYVYHKGSAGSKSFNELLDNVDGLFVENEKLKDDLGNGGIYETSENDIIKFFLSKYKRLPDEKEIAFMLSKQRHETFILPNCVDEDMFKAVRPLRKENNDGKIRIGWAGGITHRDDLALITLEIKKLMDKYKNLVFVYFGDWDDEVVDLSLIPKDRIEHADVEIHYPNYPPKLAKLGIDIAVIPLVNNKFNECKSPSKWFEMSMAGIPCCMIGHKNLAYARVVEDGVDGVLWNTPKQMMERVSEMIEDEGYRRKIADNAYQSCLDKYEIKKHWHKWEESFDKIFGGI